MITNDPKQLQKYLHANTTISRDYSTPVPSSFLQSVASAYLIDVQNFLPDMPIEFVSPNAFGRAVTDLRLYTHVDGSVKIELLRHSAQTSYINIKFLENQEDNFSNVHSNIFKLRYLKTTAYEWRLLASSYRMRSKRAEGYANIAKFLFDHLNGKYAGSNPSPETLLDYSTQLLALYTQAKEDIYYLDMAGSRSPITQERLLALRTTCWDSIQQAKPVLEKIVKTLTNYQLTPILDKEEIYSLSTVIEAAPLMARYIPLHQKLLRCLYPYIASLVDDKYILPVCPMVMDVYNSKVNKDKIRSLYEIGELGSSKASSNEAKTEALAEESTESVDLHSQETEEADQEEA